MVWGSKHILIETKVYLNTDETSYKLNVFQSAATSNNIKTILIWLSYLQPRNHLQLFLLSKQDEKIVTNVSILIQLMFFDCTSQKAS